MNNISELEKKIKMPLWWKGLDIIGKILGWNNIKLKGYHQGEIIPMENTQKFNRVLADYEMKFHTNQIKDFVILTSKNHTRYWGTGDGKSGKEIVREPSYWFYYKPLKETPKPLKSKQE